MCDFRHIKSIELNGKTISCLGHFSIDPADQKNVTTPGLYYICCTGSHYKYFDGTKWYREYVDTSYYKNLDGFKVLSTMIYDNSIHDGSMRLLDGTKVNTG